MSFTRRADESTTIRKDTAYVGDSNSPRLNVKQTSKGVLLSVCQRETSGTREHRHERITKATSESLSGENARLVTKHSLSEIVRTNDSSCDKQKVVFETHGVLRVPESVRNLSSPKKGQAIIQVGCAKGCVPDYTILDEILTCETDLSNFVSRWSGDAVKFERVTEMCVGLQELWKQLFVSGKDFTDCCRIWQNCHYVITEATRKHLARKSSKGNLKEGFVKFLESSVEFYSGLVKQLQMPEGQADKKRGKMSVLMCHHFNIHIGDLYRYREQLTAKPNWAKPRSYYLKAQQLAPKNGKSYNQLAVIAICAHRRLDAVYYYVRSLTASNPFLSAKESLAALFDETSKKAEKEEERLKVEEERKKQRRERRHKRQNKGSESEKSKEVWVLPWQVDKMEKAQPSSTRDVHSTLLTSTGRDPTPSDQPSPELIKSFVDAVLIVHGKLFTKIGLERITNAVEKCLSIWRLLLSYQLSINDTSRFLKILIVCLFSLHNAADREQGSSPAWLYYCGLSSSFILQFLYEVFQACNGLFITYNQRETLSVDGNAPQPVTHSDGSGQLEGRGLRSVEELLDHLACHLPLIKIWFDWLSFQWQLWTNCHQQIKDEIVRKFWRSAEQLLNHLIELKQLLHPNSSAATVLMSLWEDKSLAGFMPLKALWGQPPITANITTQQDSFAEGAHRITAILQTSEQLFDGAKHTSSDNNGGRNRSLPLLFDGKRFLLQEQTSSSPPAVAHTITSQEKDSESDSDSVIVEDEDDLSSQLEPGSVEGRGVLSDIEKLRIEKEQLMRKLQNQQQTKQDIEHVLETCSKEGVQHQKMIIPKYVVPDTNCFIFDLVSIQRLIHSGHFTVVIPLTVLMELEGLMKGSTSRMDSPADGAKKAVDYLKQCFEAKERFVKLLTTKGNFLSTISIRSEMTGIQISNDDYILLSSVNLHGRVDGSHKTDDGSNNSYYTVALLTDDRNLRVKAYAQEFPVRGLTEFMDWCKV